jgi:mannose-6-phosphate isomerase-like protein (cupin superfamily)
MKVSNEKLNGIVIRDTDVYVVEDNRFLNNMVLSKTILYPGQETSGHSHPGLEEVYFFKSGYGRMLIDEESMSVQAGDIVLIKDGAFHKVFNTEGSKQDLVFVCVFQSYDRNK